MERKKMDYQAQNPTRKLKCSNCINKPLCKRICKTIENYLQKKPEGKNKRKYSDRWIRAKEVPYDPAFLDTQMPGILIHKREGALVNKKAPDIDN